MVSYVKICGIDHLEDALTAIHYGADALGFVITESRDSSTRRRKYQKIVTQTPSHIDTYLVTTFTDYDILSSLINEVGFSAVQLNVDARKGSGQIEDISIEDIQKLRENFPDLKIVKGIVTNYEVENGVSPIEYGRKFLPYVDNVLLDAVSVDDSGRLLFMETEGFQTLLSAAHGGLGVTLDWDDCKRFVDQYGSDANNSRQVILAGGLNRHNVQEAATKTRVMGVDVQSGVGKWRKDYLLLEDFLRNAKGGEIQKRVTTGMTFKDLAETLPVLPRQHLFREREEYLSSISDPQIRERATHFSYRTDAVGRSRISEEEWGKAAFKLGDLADLVERNTARHAGDVVFRSNNYFLGHTLFGIFGEEAKKEGEKVASEIALRFKENEGLVARLASKGDVSGDIDLQIPIFSVLDHQKQYALILMKNVYTVMRKTDKAGGKPDEVISKEDFNNLFQLCQDTVSAVYRFILTGEVILIDYKSDLVEKLTNKLEFHDWRDSWREMDDPTKILIYTVNAMQNIDKKVDLIVNPFSGGMELGYAFRGITAALGRDVVRDVLLLKFSMHGDDDDLVDYPKEQWFEQLVSGGIPRLIRDEAREKLLVNYGLIIDDNTTSKQTLAQIREAVTSKGENQGRYGICAVEIGRENKKEFDETILIDLEFEAIGDRMSEGHKMDVAAETIKI